MSNRKQLAWVRRWAFDGIEPKKERNEKGRMAWPARFKLMPVTLHQAMPDDVPLYADGVEPTRTDKDYAIERDAARYRWLRDQAIHFTDGPAPWCVIGTCYDDSRPTHGNTLDEAIDGAMERTRSTGVPPSSNDQQEQPK